MSRSKKTVLQRVEALLDRLDEELYPEGGDLDLDGEDAEDIHRLLRKAADECGYLSNLITNTLAMMRFSYPPETEEGGAT